MTLYVVSVFLHLLAAAVWVGGIVFLVVVVVPTLRRCELPPRVLRVTVVRFRAVAWTAFATVTATGVYQLDVRGTSLGDLFDPAFRATPYGTSLSWKLGLFAVVVALAAIHDFWLGPRALDAMEQAPGTPATERARHLVGWLGRINGILTLAIIFLAVTLVRGCPSP